ncbi:hypothetical protein [Undibacterium sp.]|uniref:hypothetical protein n=1 Tax=Undibacterium sp. TaxID=1914977 RepID=UPI0027320802|nr:hypothetical protein [Undibacterium sp.]MDP1978568.1 hypothetical protein [Undibacterium sp.]
MAYDLMVGKDSRDKHAWDVVGAIEFNELPSISKLLKRNDIFFLHHISNVFEDQTFSLEEIEQALIDLLPLMASRLLSDEREMLQKLISILSYAKWKQFVLYCAAD